MNTTFDKLGALARALDTTGGNRLLRWARAWKGLLVFNYHRIGTAADSPFDHGLWSASQNDFDQQVRYLKSNFDLVGLADLKDVFLEFSRRSGSSKRYVMITFDDGYRDNYEAAFPILKQQGVPATFFLATGFLDRPRIAWWDEIAWMVRTSRQSSLPANTWTIQPVPFEGPQRQQAIDTLITTFKKLEGHETDEYLNFLAEATASGRCPDTLADGMWMTWEMAREMQAAGMGFGAHTVNHPILSSLSGEEQDLEICESKLRIETELGIEVNAFSYPVGKPHCFNETTRECLMKHGIGWAFRHHGGHCRPGHRDFYDIPRVAVEAEIGPSTMHAIASLPQVFA